MACKPKCQAWAGDATKIHAHAETSQLARAQAKKLTLEVAPCFQLTTVMSGVSPETEWACPECGKQITGRPPNHIEAAAIECDYPPLGWPGAHGRDRGLITCRDVPSETESRVRREMPLITGTDVNKTSKAGRARYQANPLRDSGKDVEVVSRWGRSRWSRQPAYTIMREFYVPFLALSLSSGKHAYATKSMNISAVREPWKLVVATSSRGLQPALPSSIHSLSSTSLSVNALSSSAPRNPTQGFWDNWISFAVRQLRPELLQGLA
ncbi:hypothetical protein GGX14DRAFT_406129 [Mycena pura]|uniref:Uncharacterized protein n=1 Tax=Mycena pura TaxID=153505 RepID=A0AAD6Y3K9_9AGAR|nr:hypothetical protein GGX14DRAFT_406129 [Mycena pura]